MKIFILFFFSISCTILPEEEFQLLTERLKLILPKSSNKKLKKVGVQFIQDPLQISLIRGDKQYAVINEDTNREDNFLQIKFVQQDPDLVIFKALSKMITEDNKLNNVNEIANFIKEDLEYVIDNHEKEEQQYIDKVKLVINQIESKLGNNKSKCDQEIDEKQQKSTYYCEDDLGTMLLLITLFKIDNHIMINATFNKSQNEIYFTINTDDDTIKDQLSEILDSIEQLDFVQDDIISNTYQKLIEGMYQPASSLECEESKQENLCKQDSKTGKSCYFRAECSPQEELSLKRKLNLKSINQKPYLQINKNYQIDNIYLSQKINFYQNKNRKLKEGDPFELFKFLELFVTQYEFEHISYIHIKYLYNDYIHAEFSIPYTNQEVFDQNIEKIITSFKSYDTLNTKVQKKIKDNSLQDNQELLSPENLAEQLNKFFKENKNIPHIGNVECFNDPENTITEENDDFDETFFQCLNEDQDRIVTGALRPDNMYLVFYIQKEINNKLQTITESYVINPKKKFELNEILKEAYEQYIDSSKNLLII